MSYTGEMPQAKQLSDRSVTARLPSGLVRELDREASELEMTRSELLRILIEESLASGRKKSKAKAL